MTFTVVPRRLPHEGVIPGARGHKKVIVPKGTVVFCIQCYSSYYWAVYLQKEQAEETVKQFEKTILPGTRRYISLENLLAWNFKSYIPLRVVRPKEGR